MKCKIKYCRAEAETLLPDGTGLCDKHFAEQCEREDEQWRREHENNQ